MNIFSVPVEIVQCNDIDNESLISYAYTLKQSNQGRTVSNKGGFQSNNLQLHNIGTLAQEIMLHVSSYTNKVNLKKNCNVSMTNAWLNINPKHSYNISHIHSGFVSGVYYAQACREMGELVLHYPSNAKAVSWDSDWFESYNHVNNLSFRITPKPGMLVLFPAWLEHSVEMNTIEEDRISLSFNTRVDYEVN